MRIFYVPGPYPFCYYYRGYLPGVYGNQMVVPDFLHGLETSGEELLAKAKEADVIVLQRPNSKAQLELAQALKAMGKFVIFENDDTYKSIDLSRLENDKQRQIAADLQFYTEEILKVCDAAIASTEILGEEYRAINPNTIVLKNTTDPLDEFECKKNETGKFRIGFIASVTTNDDYHHIKDQIRQLDERGDITIVVLGLKYRDGSIISFMQEDYDFWMSLKNVEFHPYVKVTEYMVTLADLALDLAVIPRKDNYFNRCKSNLKALEMSLLKIPVIAQSFGDGTSPYEGDLSPYLTLVEDNSQWYSKIVEIKDNHESYILLAERAREFVLEHFNIATYAQVWADSICKLTQSSSPKRTTPVAASSS